MLVWALTFLVLSLATAYLGFFGFIGPAAVVAKLFLIVFAILFALSAYSGMRSSGREQTATPKKGKRPI